MATRFYLPASGTAPLSSLAVDSSWGRSEDLVRRPCDVTKSNTSLTQKSYAWAATATDDWVWVQFQSKRLAAGYSWTTSDTVSMVIKVAEAAAQVDSHLAYCIRVVSGDGSTVRGTVGVYQTSSTEYPTSLSSIATRIHSARTNGASNFSSQAGDRIIIEIGHYGVTPTANYVYHNYGDPSATSDYALTADLTTDLCPWVELSRDVSFSVTSSKSAYMRGKSTATPAVLKAYANGSNPSYPANSHEDAYLFGLGKDISHKDAFVRGKLVADPDHKDAYIRGLLSTELYAKSAYMRGTSTQEESKDAYLRGRDLYIAQKGSYIKGKSSLEDHKDASLTGSISTTSHNDAYMEGFSTGGSSSSSIDAFMLGIGNILVPDGKIADVGTWYNELGSQTNIWTSIDESAPSDSDYIHDLDPANNNYIEFSLTNPGGTPSSGNVVVLWRGKDSTASGNVSALVQLRQGSSTVIASKQETFSSVARIYYFQLTAEERSNITDWTDLRIRIIEAIV